MAVTYVHTKVTVQDTKRHAVPILSCGSMYYKINVMSWWSLHV